MDDFSKITKETRNLEKFRKLMRGLNEANPEVKMDKCRIAGKRIEWLGYKLLGKKFFPGGDKVQGVCGKLRPSKFERTLHPQVNQYPNYMAFVFHSDLS